MENQSDSNRKTLKNKCLKLLLASPLIQSYSFTFPNGEIVKLNIACVKNTELRSTEGIIGQFLVQIEEIQDWPCWLQFLSIQKRLHEISVAESLAIDLFYDFDAIKCTSGGKIYGIFGKSVTKSLQQFVNSTKPLAPQKQVIINEYKHIMNDMQEHQIMIGQNFDVNHLRINKKGKPVVRVNPQYFIFNQSTYQYNIYQKDSSPYIKDVKKVQDLLSHVFTQPVVKETTIPAFSSNLRDTINQIIEFAVLLLKINRKSFNQLQNEDKYSDFFNKDDFLKDLQTHYCIEGHYQSSKQLMVYRRSLLAQQVKTNPKHLPDIDSCIENQLEAKIEEQKYNGTHKTPLDNLKKLFYNPLKTPITEKTTGFISSDQITQAIKRIKPINRCQKCHYHFLKAKQAWMHLKFYRCLAHLQKAKKYTNNHGILAKIYLQMGRVWSHLYEFSKAEQNYLQSLSILQNLIGCENIRLLPILQNLVIFYSQKGNSKKVSYFNTWCENIKKRFNSLHLRMMPNLIHSVTASIVYGTNNLIDTGNKSGKTLSKDDIIKLQNERIPILAKIWHIARPFFEKGEKNQKILDENQQLFQYGQLQILYFIIKLTAYSQNDSILTKIEEANLYCILEKSKTSNTRMYYRLTFLLSYYYEKNKDMVKAISCMETLLASSAFSHTISNSFRKRILELAKKGDFVFHLKLIYFDIEWLNNEGMMEELYNAAVFLQNHNEHLLCRKACKTYLQSIKQYKVTDRSQEIQFILAISLIQMQLFAECWQQLKILSANKKTEKKKLNNLILHVCKKAFIDKEYTFYIDVFAQMICLELFLQENYKKIQAFWNELIESLLIINTYSTKIQQMLIQMYDSIPGCHQEISKSSQARKINQLSIKKKVWTELNLKVNGTSTNSQLELKKTDAQIQIEKQIEQICRQYVRSEAKHLLYQLRNNLQQKSKRQIITILDVLVDFIEKMSIQKGKTSETIVFLHAMLYQTVTSLNLIQEETLILLWFSSFSHKIISQWEKQLWGDVQARELLLDRLLSELFKNDPDANSQIVLKNLWWINSKRKDLLKLQKAFKKINTSDQSNQEDILTFKMLYGSYFSQNDDESFLLKEVIDKVGVVFDDQL